MQGMGPGGLLYKPALNVSVEGLLLSEREKIRGGENLDSPIRTLAVK